MRVFFQKMLVVHERSALKNSFSTYVWSKVDSCFCEFLYLITKRSLGKDIKWYKYHIFLNLAGLNFFLNSICKFYSTKGLFKAIFKALQLEDYETLVHNKLKILHTISKEAIINLLCNISGKTETLQFWLFLPKWSFHCYLNTAYFFVNSTNIA